MANPHDVALARRFFEGNGQSSAEGAAFNITHHVPMAELARMGDVTGRGGDMGDAWLMEQQNHIRAYEQSKTQATWASEFGNSPQQLSPSGLATHNNIYSQPGCAYFAEYLDQVTDNSQSSNNLLICLRVVSMVAQSQWRTG